MIKSFSAVIKNRDAYDAARHIANSSGILKDLFEDQSPEGISRYENIEELINAIKEFSESPRPTGENGGQEEKTFRTLDEFMQEISLLTDADDKDKQDRDHVSLMTVHAAKGLEFPYVYVVGMEENLFPTIQSLHSRPDLEEERRLFYVAVTRAMNNLTLSYAENRYRWGDLTFCEPSRFIDEIDAKYIEIPKKVPIPGLSFHDHTDTGFFPPHIEKMKERKLRPLHSTEDNPSKDDGQASNPFDIQVGMTVEHDKFGRGKVVSLEGHGDNRKATVFFPAIGQKQLLLKFARLKIV
jgi:DNA helicase-2/ATP-dependent DNA helicase PcrA